MSQGPKISNKVKRIIYEEALRDRSYPRTAVAAKLADIIEKMGEPVPKLETLEKMISHARNHAPSPLDAPWSLGSLVEYPIAAEDLPRVLQVFVQQEVVNKHRPPEIQHPLTIRQALWAARLSPLIEDVTMIFIHAQIYASRDRACEVSGSPFDTTDLDAGIIRTLSEPIGEALGIPADHISPPITKIVVHTPFDDMESDLAKEQ